MRIVLIECHIITLNWGMGKWMKLFIPSFISSPKNYWVSIMHHAQRGAGNNSSAQKSSGSSHSNWGEQINKWKKHRRQFNLMINVMWKLRDRERHECSWKSGLGGFSEKVQSEMRPGESGEAGIKLGRENSRQREEQVRKPPARMSWGPIWWEKTV